MSIHNKNEPKRLKVAEALLKGLKLGLRLPLRLRKMIQCRIKTETEQVTDSYFFPFNLYPTLKPK